MDDLFFGGGWLEDLLKETGAPPSVRDKVWERIQALTRDGAGGWEEEWGEVNGLLEEGQVGPALEKAVGSLSRTVELLGETLGEKKSALGKPFSPFLVRSKEIRKVLHPKEDVRELARSRDDLDAVISLEMINDTRRLLASWGAGVWGEAPLELIPRLGEDLEELRKTHASFLEEDYNLEGLEDMNKEMELADRFATMATRFGHDLMELHVLNAANPEVRMRFDLLWGTVRQLEEDGSVQAAAFESLQVLEEAMDLAGMGGGELLQRVDLLYDFFSDVEELRRAVDHLVSVSRDGEGRLGEEQGRSYIQAISGALGDMGLEIG